MIKFILERQVNLNQQPKKRRNFSHLNFKAIRQEPAAIDPQTTFQAVAQYKQCGEQIEELAKRLTVLKQQQRKMESKSIKNNQQLEHYKSIRQQISLQRKKSQEYRKELAKEMQLTKSIIANQREMQAKKLEQTKRQMYFQRWYNYLDKRQNYKNQMNATKLHFQSQLIRKRKKKQEIQKIQQKQRSNIQQYYEKKKNKVKLNSLEQITRINSMTESKLDQLSTLSHIESILLSRQARSRMDSQESTSRLNSLSPISKPTIKLNNNTLHTPRSPNDIYII